MSSPAAGAGEPVARWTLAAAAFLHAAIFAWAAVVIPLGEWTLLAVAFGVMALVHFLTALAASTGSAHRATIWRVASLTSIAFFVLLLALLLDAGSYLRALYGGLGEGVAAALLACAAPLALFTIPFALWGVASTRTAWRPRWGVLGLVLVTAASAVTIRSAARAGAEPAPGVDVRELESALGHWDELPYPSFATSLHSPAPVDCIYEPGSERARPLATVFVSYVGRDAGGTGRRAECFQTAPERVVEVVSARLRAAAFRAPAKIDLVTGTADLGAAPRLVEALALRPALDGACWRGSCLMPWQLVATQQFVQFQPFPFIPDLRLGVSGNALGARLGRVEARGLAGLTRLVTASWVVTESGELVRLERLRPRRAELTRESLDRSARLARAHILSAQLDQGVFRYVLDPYTGGQFVQDFVLPRQAGTTLALCESAVDGSSVEAPALASLRAMAAWERRAGTHAALVKPADSRVAHLGDTALPLIAFVACRERLAPPDRASFDPLLGGLGRWMLRMQRADGSFYPSFDLGAGEPIDGPDALYAGGQAVYALSLLEGLARADPALGLPDAATLGLAVERAMSYFGGPYWDRALLRHFYLEENWHCLAARASLAHHRNEAYEQFCLDYMEFKKRIVLDAESGVAPEFVGGHGFGNLLPPHNTPSAGLGETLAAAIALKLERGEDVARDRRLLTTMLEFVVSRQWTEPSCFACDARRLALGSFSESMASPLVRIDYVQHALSALVHGRAALGWPHETPSVP